MVSLDNVRECLLLCLGCLGSLPATSTDTSNCSSPGRGREGGGEEKWEGKKGREE